MLAGQREITLERWLAALDADLYDLADTYYMLGKAKPLQLPLLVQQLL